MDYPLRFTPLLKVRVWGGDVLATRLGDRAAEPIGESWELCDHGADVSVIANGPLAGRSLHDLMCEAPKALVGAAVDPEHPERFPLMLKLLDSRDVLSVQVHPDDRYADAQTPGELGKTEAWYILEADADAAIYRGVRPGTSAEDLRAATEAGTVDQLLKRLPARPGDCFFIPAGTIHALGAGLRLCEIQQNSDTTYRLFDWNRVGLDGTPRTLHTDHALAVSVLHGTGPDRAEPEPLEQAGATRERLVACEKLAVERLRDFCGPAPLDTAGHSCHILTGLADRLEVVCTGGRESLAPWETCLVPAAAGAYEVRGPGAASGLLFHVPPAPGA